jgi:hypothetical protein
MASQNKLRKGQIQVPDGRNLMLNLPGRVVTKLVETTLENTGKGSSKKDNMDMLL